MSANPGARGRGPALAEQSCVFVIGLVLAIVIGLSIGVLGGGGSILTMPVLHYVLGIDAHDAIAASLVVVGVTSAVSLAGHAHAGRVRWRSGLAFAATSMAAAYPAGRLATHLPGELLVGSFAVVMVAAGGAMLARKPCATARPPRLVRLAGIGIVVGAITGLLGAGGGFIIVPALTMAGGLAVRDAIGTSVLVIAANAFAALAATAGSASIDLAIVGPITLVAIAGSVLGIRLGQHLSPDQLRRSFGWFVIILGTAILARVLL